MTVRLNSKRIVAFIALVTFFLSNQFSLPLLQAAPNMPVSKAATFPKDIQSIRLPEKLGKIEEAFQGTSERAVVLVQDAHAIPDAQRNIQKLIGFFQKEYGLDLVGLEGAAARLDSQFFKSFPDKELLKKTFEEYFDKGELTGGTAAAIFNDSKSSYYGIEDWNLYEQGLALYRTAMDKEPGRLEKLANLEKELQNKKEKAYSKDLLQIDQAFQLFRENHKDLTDVLRLLAKVKRPEQGTELAILLEESERAGEGQASVEIEVKKIANQIEKYLKSQTPSSANNKTFSSFHEKLQEFQTSRISPQAFALFLKELASKDQMPMRVSDELSRLMGNQKRMRDIGGTKFFRDFEHYADSVKQSLFRNEEEKNLDKESHKLELLGRFARLELSREDWKEVKVFLKTTQSEFSKDSLKAHIAFYENAEKRDETLFNHLMSLMKENNSQSALLVAGGFHTEGFTQRLKEKDISYVLLMPQINAIPEATNYREQMKGEVSWKDYFEVENDRINLYKAFVRGTRDRLLKESKEEPARLLKFWRDQIIRDLASDEKITKVSDYTKFIDEVAQNSQKKNFLKQSKRVEKFIKGLRELEAKGQITGQNIFKITQPATISTMVGGVDDPSVSLPKSFFSRITYKQVFNNVKEGPPKKRSELRANNENWVPLSNLVGAINDTVLTRPVSNRPSYDTWLNEPAKLKEWIESQQGRYEAARLHIHTKRQAAVSEQALVELLSNALDAVDPWIRRFGLGFYQALGELDSADDRVRFAGYTKTGRLGIDFKQEKGQLFIRPMTEAELNQELAGTSQSEPRTSVSVRKSLSTEKIASYSDYLRERIQDNQRYPILMNGSQINSQIPIEAGKPSIEVTVNESGYVVRNPGLLTPEILFENVIIPRQGAEPGLNRAKRESGEMLKQAKIRAPGQKHNQTESTVVLSVGGVGVEVERVRGVNLVDRMVIDLPADVTLNSARGEVILDAKLEAAWRRIMEHIIETQDPRIAIALANTVMAYWRTVQSRSPRDGIIVERLTEALRNTLRPYLLQLRERHDFIALPALAPFYGMDLPEISQDRIVHMDTDLIDFDAEGVPGMISVEANEGFLSKTGYTLYHVAYRPEFNNRQLAVVGRAIIIDRTLYEWARGNAWRQLLINLRMTFQIGYGPPRFELGWWQHRKELGAEHAPQAQLPSSESNVFVEFPKYEPVSDDPTLRSLGYFWSHGLDVDAETRGHIQAWEVWNNRHPQLGHEVLLNDDALPNADWHSYHFFGAENKYNSAHRPNGSVVLSTWMVRDEDYRGGYLISFGPGQTIGLVEAQINGKETPLKSIGQRPDGSLLFIAHDEKRENHIVILTPDNDLLALPVVYEGRQQNFGAHNGVWIAPDGTLVLKIHEKKDDEPTGLAILSPDNKLRIYTQKQLQLGVKETIQLPSSDYANTEDNFQRPDGTLILATAMAEFSHYTTGRLIFISPNGKISTMAIPRDTEKKNWTRMIPLPNGSLLIDVYTYSYTASGPRENPVGLAVLTSNNELINLSSLVPDGKLSHYTVSKPRPDGSLFFILIFKGYEKPVLGLWTKENKFVKLEYPELPGFEFRIDSYPAMLDRKDGSIGFVVETRRLPTRPKPNVDYDKQGEDIFKKQEEARSQWTKEFGWYWQRIFFLTPDNQWTTPDLPSSVSTDIHGIDTQGQLGPDFPLFAVYSIEAGKAPLFLLRLNPDGKLEVVSLPSQIGKDFSMSVEEELSDGSIRLFVSTEEKSTSGLDGKKHYYVALITPDGRLVIQNQAFLDGRAVVSVSNSGEEGGGKRSYALADGTVLYTFTSLEQQSGESYRSVYGLRVARDGTLSSMPRGKEPVPIRNGSIEATSDDIIRIVRFDEVPKTPPALSDDQHRQLDDIFKDEFWRTGDVLDQRRRRGGVFRSLNWNVDIALRYWRTASLMGASLLSQLMPAELSSWEKRLSKTDSRSRAVHESFFRLIGPLSQDAETAQRLAERWTALVEADAQLAEEFLGFLRQPLPTGLVPAAWPLLRTHSPKDITEAPPAWQGLVAYFRERDLTALLPLITTARQLPRTPESLPASFSLAELLAFVRYSRTELLTPPLKHETKLALNHVKNVFLRTRSALDAEREKSRMVRTIRGQSDGYAVWLRELIQNARDELKRAGRTSEKITVDAGFASASDSTVTRIVRVNDAIGMSLQKLLTVYFPIDVTDKEAVAGLTGIVGQGNYSVWLDADRVVIQTSDGQGTGYRVVLDAKRDAAGELEDVIVSEFTEFESRQAGTTIEHHRHYKTNDGRRFLEAALLQTALHRYVGDVQDTPIVFQGQPIRESVRALGSENDTEWGKMELGWTEGPATVTEDGFFVSVVDPDTWIGVPLPIQMALQSRGRVRLRYPPRLPLTEVRSSPAWRLVDAERFNRLRLAVFARAAVEALQQYGVRIPDLPQDVISEYRENAPDFVERDAAALNKGGWNDVDWSRYGNNRHTIQLLMRLKGPTSGKSLVDIRREIEAASASVRTFDFNMPGIQRMIQSGASDMQSLKENLGASRRLVEANLPYFLSLAQKLFTALGEDTLQHVFWQYDQEGPLGGMVAEQGPNELAWNVAWAQAQDHFLANLPAEPSVAEMERLKTVVETMIHEYVHVLEIREYGESTHSYVTHQREGVLEDSFARKMEETIEAVLKAKKDVVATKASEVRSELRKQIAPQLKSQEANLVSVQIGIILVADMPLPQSLADKLANLLNRNELQVDQVETVVTQISEGLKSPDDLRPFLIPIVEQTKTELKNYITDKIRELKEAGVTVGLDVSNLEQGNVNEDTVVRTVRNFLSLFREAGFDISNPSNTFVLSGKKVGENITEPLRTAQMNFTAKSPNEIQKPDGQVYLPLMQLNGQPYSGKSEFIRGILLMLQGEFGPEAEELGMLIQAADAISTATSQNEDQIKRSFDKLLDAVSLFRQYREVTLGGIVQSSGRVSIVNVNAIHTLLVALATEAKARSEIRRAA